MNDELPFEELVREEGARGQRHRGLRLEVRHLQQEGAVSARFAGNNQLVDARASPGCGHLTTPAAKPAACALGPIQRA
ncbi:MAG: hypothetical protein KA191_00680 [Verrucomicrobia bacterium]|nr:hypothetical protein [Verrucomicrobiota bacterium]